eukprot:TRINITY_DN2285_c0_g1_i2.p1 TRINITY_DN2285_c0_g1~~TRINITY_DN2285_c0_g1_i2.p1  ORF type:complete len:709 (-),score=115.41 TRINITY_DN2285_c0_g1_i2:1344-3470(-)
MAGRVASRSSHRHVTQFLSSKRYPSFAPFSEVREIVRIPCSSNAVQSGRNHTVCALPLQSIVPFPISQYPLDYACFENSSMPCFSVRNSEVCVTYSREYRALLVKNYRASQAPQFAELTRPSEAGSNLNVMFSRRPIKRLESAYSHQAEVCGVRRLSMTSSGPPPASSLHQLKLAQTGEGIAECELLRWFVQEGETVATFQPVCEVQSDKATVEITSRYDGTVVRTMFTPGDMVQVGETLCEILPLGAVLPSASSSPSPSPCDSCDIPCEDPQTEYHSLDPLPLSPPSPSSADQVDDNEKVMAFGPLYHLRFATAAVEREAKAKGIRLIDVIGSGKDGQVLSEDLSAYEKVSAMLDAPSSSNTVSSESAVNDGEDLATGPTQQLVLATPAVRRVAREYGINLGDVRGSGRDGQILLEDLTALAEAAVDEEGFDRREGGAFEGKMTGEEREGDLVGDEELRETVQRSEEKVAARELADTVVPIRGYRRTMVKTMEAALKVPHFYFMEEFDMGQLTQLRNALKEEAMTEGVKLTHLPFLVKALSHAMKKFPEVNATVNSDVSELICKGSHNIGIAMATPNGLVVPNIKQCQDKSVIQIGIELQRLRHLALANKLATEDLAGGTITISNVGSIGGTFAGPVVNVPQVAIVALGKTKRVALVDEEDEVYTASVMPVSWAADHRVIDGATLAAFCMEWKAIVERPGRLLLHMR